MSKPVARNVAVLGLAQAAQLPLADFVCDGFRTASAEAYRQRLEICDGCDQRRGNRCMKCGCRLSLKARGRAFQCPLGKWPDIPTR